MTTHPAPARVDGAKIKAIRRPFFQISIAQAMTARGHVWYQQTLARVEAGKRELSLAEAVDLADVLGCKPEDFLEGAPEPQIRRFDPPNVMASRESVFQPGGIV